MSEPARGREEVREMLTADQVLTLIPVSRSTLFRLERDDLFPKGEAITPHRKLWFKDEVVVWQKALQDPTSALAQALKARLKPKRRSGQVVQAPKLAQR